MKLTRQQQIYAGILGMAFIALLADRTALRPSEAMANSAAEYAVDVSAFGEDGTPPAPAMTVSVRQRLQTAAVQHNVNPLDSRDAFAPPWQPSPPTSENAQDVRFANAEFARAHRLTAVMAGGSGFAVVDGKCLRVGQTIDGVRLVSVRDHLAVFESAEGVFEMPVDADIAATRPGESTPTVVRSAESPIR